MKRLFYKGLVVFAAVAIISAVNVENAGAQRPSRSSGGRSGSVAPFRVGGSVSRGSGMIRSNNRIAQAPRGYSSGIRTTRPGFGYHRPSYGYRPGYGRTFYRPYYSYYNFYRPFLGFRIGVLPYGYYPFYFGANQFYYSGGLFYQQNNNQYEVVVPPVGAQVPSLPEEAKLVTINGTDYYEYKGVYYTQRQNADGATVYVVAGKDGVLNTDGPVDTHEIGEIIDALPDGCREVVIKNEKYFVSPDDVYYEEVVDGNNTSYRVIGKLF